ncbi:hypothetical protein HOLleu_44901 [Holothuria leucospilota]|uniref:Uncharacterized protein n=1 Tax=Holothuria leucospilota TaxID=206669 RepID=A0A9Q0Y8I5_HOLLE|nr:hypothetical protein HOLleu_44901 [Holothuria leucospilota]
MRSSLRDVIPERRERDSVEDATYSCSMIVFKGQATHREEQGNCSRRQGVFHYGRPNTNGSCRKEEVG